MKKLLIACCLIFGFLLSNAQKTTEFGFFLGRSYYLGEINPKQHIGEGVGSLAYGAVFRYNLNKRYSLKASLIRGALKGDDLETEFPFNNSWRKASFESKLTEFSGQIEFNFLPYETGDKKHFISPYLFIGMAIYNYEPSTSIDGQELNEPENEAATKVSYPFGPGIKLSFSSRLSLSLEWGFRKTSNDAIDGLPNRVADFYEVGKTYDNDWYVLSGFMLTYKLTRVGPCPAYNF